MRDDVQIEKADAKLRLFVAYARSLIRLYEEANEVSMRLNTYGVSSPKIMSPEEAKYQKGTRIYSTVNLLDLMEQESEAWNAYHDASTYCNRMARSFIGLADDELRLLYLRYEKGYTFEQIGMIINYSTGHVRRLLVKCLEKF